MDYSSHLGRWELTELIVGRVRDDQGLDYGFCGKDRGEGKIIELLKEDRQMREEFSYGMPAVLSCFDIHSTKTQLPTKQVKRSSQNDSRMMNLGVDGRGRAAEWKKDKELFCYISNQ